MNIHFLIKASLFVACAALFGSCHLVFPKDQFKDLQRTVPTYFGTYKVTKVRHESDWNGSKYTIDSTVNVQSNFVFYADPNFPDNFYGFLSIQNKGACLFTKFYGNTSSAGGLGGGGLYSLKPLTIRVYTFIPLPVQAVQARKKSVRLLMSYALTALA